MIRVFLRSLAILAFWAGLAAAPSYAQNAEQKGAEPGKGEAAKEGVKRSDDAAAGRSTIGAAARPECTWLGERAVKLIRSDDLDTAFRHLDLYDRFGCPGEHVRMSFRCVVQWGQKDPKEQKDQKDQKDAKDQKDQKDQKPALDVNSLVELCWNDPTKPPLSFGPASASAATEKSGTK
jgi:hypothetical protein